MIHLLYVSSAKGAMTEDDLLYLLEQSRSRNEKLNITGMLLYSGGNFMQILEGEDKDVEDIYDAIKIDPRHKGSILVLKQNIEMRTFPDWSMGFKNYTKKSTNSEGEYEEVLNRKRNPEKFANSSDMVLDLLDQFKQGNI
ncbi:BLUF domain-containing protein [Reinekea sp.]|jgi:hypothetical protein|uniref:BLUF domain-containing protein n=1 Tax=Reinekea sp. TaxID=1970455 RepID=UPI002A829389|nr:BLUF domain-containing protein [Reinekea sp.]